MPSTLPYTIPATTLFATCVVYGRLAADNEILAIKSAGINAIKIVRPGIMLGLVMSTATMGLYYRIIPYTHHLLRAMVFNDAEEWLYTLLKKHNAISSFLVALCHVRPGRAREETAFAGLQTQGCAWAN